MIRWIAFAFLDPKFRNGVEAIHCGFSSLVSAPSTAFFHAASCGSLSLSPSFSLSSCPGPRPSRRSYDHRVEINEAAIIKKRKFMPAASAPPRHFITQGRVKPDVSSSLYLPLQLYFSIRFRWPREPGLGTELVTRSGSSLNANEDWGVVGSSRNKTFVFRFPETHDLPLFPFLSLRSSFPLSFWEG